MHARERFLDEDARTIRWVQYPFLATRTAKTTLHRRAQLLCAGATTSIEHTLPTLRVVPEVD